MPFTPTPYERPHRPVFVRGPTSHWELYEYYKRNSMLEVFFAMFLQG